MRCAFRPMIVSVVVAGTALVVGLAMADDAEKTTETITTPTLQAKPDDDAEVVKNQARKNALPFIKIDREAGEIRVEGFISPRMETLELFACGNGIREHEAVISVKARPRDINVALILLGREPGHPALWTKDGQFLPPYGPVFRVFVEYMVDGKPKRLEAHEMLKDGFTGKPARPQKWVFAGGAMRKGHFIPDYEGTVVCLSNFEAPILDVPYESSAKNSELMFAANDAAIPEAGTPATLVLKATGEKVEGKKLAWSLVIQKDGSMSLDGKASSLEDLDERLKQRDPYLQKVQIFGHPEAPLGRMIDAMSVVTRYPLEVELYKKLPMPDDPEAPRKETTDSSEAPQKP